MSSYIDKSPEYWQEYSNLQKVKHDLIREYLKGWFPKLGSWAGRVLYLDTHAGRGKYLTGQYGSPLIALNTFLSHSYREIILEKSEVVFYFIERDADNLEALKNELEQLDIPNNVHIETDHGECFSILDGIAQSLRQSGTSLAPAFIFVDPYGFKIPVQTLANLMSFQRVELFINVIWRELDMAIRHGCTNPSGGHAKNLDAIFGSRDWASKIVSTDPSVRADQAVQLLQDRLGAKWYSYIKMLGSNGAIRYFLLHLTNHDSGRDLMKEAIWKVCPDGGFYARKNIGDPNQQVLISPEPDLRALEKWVIDCLEFQPRRWSFLIDLIRPEPWKASHLNSVIRKLRKEGTLTGESYQGKFGATSNPLLRLSEKK